MEAMFRHDFLYKAPLQEALMADIIWRLPGIQLTQASQAATTMAMNETSTIKAAIIMELAILTTPPVIDVQHTTLLNVV